MKDKKILYVPTHDLTIAELMHQLNEFTIHNGCYPDVIHMELKTVMKYMSLLIYPSELNKLTFKGIPIKAK